MEELVLGSYRGPLIGDYRDVLRQVTQGLQHLHANQIASLNYAEYVQSRIKDNMRVRKLGSSASGSVLFVHRNRVFPSLFKDQQVKARVSTFLIMLTNC